MSDKEQKGYKVKFNFEIHDRDNYSALIDSSVNEYVPKGKDPIKHLKARLREEIDRADENADIDWTKKWSKDDSGEDIL
jgi:hypothetical protein